jgi:hypothetical protein
VLNDDPRILFLVMCIEYIRWPDNTRKYMLHVLNSIKDCSLIACFTGECGVGYPLGNPAFPASFKGLVRPHYDPYDSNHTLSCLDQQCFFKSSSNEWWARRSVPYGGPYERNSSDGLSCRILTHVCPKDNRLLTCAYGTRLVHAYPRLVGVTRL